MRFGELALAGVLLCGSSLSWGLDDTECTPDNCEGPPRIETIVVEAESETISGTYGTLDYFSLRGWDNPNLASWQATSWNSPSSPRCQNEANALNGLLAANAAWLQSASGGGAPSGPPPGRLLMPGPFGDPAFQGAGWGKYEWGVITHISSQGIGTRYSVHIHQMVNTLSGAIDQIRFNSTEASGCTGTTIT